MLGLENRALTVRGDDGEPFDVPDSGFLNSSLTGIGGLHLKSLRCLFGERQIQRMRVNRVMINSRVSPILHLVCVWTSSETATIVHTTIVLLVNVSSSPRSEVVARSVQ